MAEADHIRVRASDGRSLGVLLTPPTGGWTLLFLSGTPNAPVSFVPLEAAAAARGMRVVQYARPGYAGSDRLPGRSVADAAADVAAILDHLGVARCLALGHSGGGPHALACAARLPERIAAAGTIAPLAPFDADGLDWLAGQGTENVVEWRAAVAGPAALRPFLEAAAPGLASVTASNIALALGDLLSPLDRASLTGDRAEWAAASFRAGVSPGIWGWYDDDLAFVHPWGFELAAIRVPVTLWQGEQDRMVPVSHGRWLASRIPGVRARILPDHGHVSLVVGSLEPVLDDLAERASAG